MRTTSLKFLALLLLLFAAVGVNIASADTILIHQFSENYFDTGGTSIVNLGDPANAWTVGNTTGSVTWEVTEKVFWDTVAQTTQFAYTVFNDTLATPITSFSLLNPYGFQAMNSSAPAGWTFSAADGKWTWSTTGSGLAMTNSTNTMDVWLQGLVPVGFVADTTIISGDTQTSSDWYVSSPAPEPGTLLLLGTGLAGAGFWGRRILFGNQRLQAIA